MKRVADFRLAGFTLVQLLFVVFAWSLLVLRFGYRYGTGDQVELLPYTLFLHNPNLYPNDFFIQGLHATVPNERTVMANLLLPFVNHLEVTCLLLHLFSTALLVLGMERFTRRFIKNKYFAWLAVLVTLIPLNDYTLGNVDLYSDCFQASALSVAIVVWGLVFFLNRKYVQASALLSVATFIQLLDGLDVMMVLTATLFVACAAKEVKWKYFALFTGIYAVTAGAYLITIFAGKSTAVNDSCGPSIFDILFLFRHPHHFIFASFSKVKIMAFLFFTALAILFFALRNRQMLRFTLLSLAGVIIYAFCVDGLNSIFIGNFQFYKVTQWLKFFGVVALTGFVAEVWEKRHPLWHRITSEVWLLPLSIVAVWVVIWQCHTSLPYRVPMQLFGLKQQDDMISICTGVQQLTPPDAVFIQPFENTELKYYAQRSSYVEFKANVRNRAYVCQWADRIKQVYGVGAGMEVNGFALQQLANDKFYTLTHSELETLKANGVTHILTRKGKLPALGTFVTGNNSYEVYKL
jgi:hypothetical protein